MEVNEDTPEVPVDETPEVTPEEAPTEETPTEEVPEETPSEEAPSPEPEPEEAEESEEEEVAEDDSAYNSYDDPALKQAVILMEEANLPVEEANAIFAEAVETGDLSKIKRDVLIEKIGKEKADVVLVLAESYYNTTFSAMRAIKEEAFSLTGGEENFNTMRDWAAEKAKTDVDFAKDLAEFRSMLDSKQPRAIKAAVRELFDMYKQDPDTTIPADVLAGDKTGSSAGLEPLSREDYTNEVQKAHRDGTYDQVSTALWARRKAGMKKGI